MGLLESGKVHAAKYDEVDPEFASFVRQHYNSVMMDQQCFYEMVRRPYTQGQDPNCFQVRRDTDNERV